MSNDSYIKIQTTENTTVLLKKDQVSAVEEIPSTARTEGYLKLYVAGYSFGVKTDDNAETFADLLAD